MRAACLLLPLLLAAAAPQDPKAPRPVDVLVQELGSKFGKNRSEAARELGLHGPAAAKAVPDLVKLLGDAHEPSKVEAAIALARIDPAQSAGLPLLRKHALDGKDPLRGRALEALLLYPVNAEGVPEALLAEAASPVFGARILARFREWGAAGAPSVARALGADDPGGAAALWPVLTDLGVEGAPLILPLLDHPADGLRAKAADHLAHCLLAKYPPEVARALEMIQEPAADAARAEEAIAAAAKAGYAAVPGLAGTVAHCPETGVRVRAAEALARIGQDARGAVAALRYATASFSAEVQDAAVRALWKIDPEAGKLPARSAKPSSFLSRRTAPGRAKARPFRTEYADASLSALDWLARHQDDSGAWRCSAFEVKCRKNRCGDVGMPYFDAGATALALLAFLGEGETHLTERHGQVVRRGVRNLVSRQDAEGGIGRFKGAGHWVYNHALASLALTEAWALTGSPELKAPAQNAANFVMACQNPYMAWRYGVRPQDNDSSVTGWMVLALWAAKQAGLEVDPACFEGAKAWFDKVTEPEYGRAGYTARGNSCEGYKGAPGLDKFPADKTEGMTAVAVLTRILCGADREDEYVLKGADLCLKSLPLYDEAAGTIDFHYWHFGTLAMYHVGGQHDRKWDEALRKAVVDSQRRDKADDRYGSWDLVDRWGFGGGRIYTTAINALTLQTPYRYPREWDRARR